MSLPHRQVRRLRLDVLLLAGEDVCDEGKDREDRAGVLKGGRPRRRQLRLSAGFYILAASFVILFLNTGARYIIGVMVKPMSGEFGWSRGAISAAVFLNMAVYAVAVLVTGRLYDRYGAKWVVGVSTLLFVAGYALMATMHSLWQFLLYYGVISAAGLGGTTVPMFGSIIGHWFEKRRGLAVSLALTGSCLGQFFLVPVFSDMIVVSGWRSTSLWIAGLSLVVNLVFTFLFIRSRPDRVPVEVVVISGDGARPAAAVSRDRANGASRAVSTHVAAGARDLSLGEALRTRSLWLFTVAMFVCGSADALVTTHLVPLVTDYGISTASAAGMLAWLGLLSLVGILLAGPASDTIGNKIPIAATFVLRVGLLLMLLELKGTTPFWIFSLGFGLTLLVTAPLTPTLVSALYGVKHIGFISGFITTVHMLGGGLWAYVGGVVFDETGNYDLAFLISAAMAAVALVCIMLIREERHLPPAPALSLGSNE